MGVSLEEELGVKTVRNFRHLLVLVVLTVFAGAAWAEVCPGSKVRKALLAQYDQTAILTQAEAATAKAEHAPWGLPSCPKVLAHREYLVCYDLDHRIALWVSYKLKREDVKDVPRLDAFRTDPRLTDEENAHCADYRGSGYDRGHAVPRGDMNRSPAVQADTFFFSNMSPQTPILNRGM